VAHDRSVAPLPAYVRRAHDMPELPLPSDPDPHPARGPETTPAARLRRRLVWGGIALIVLIIAADAYEGWQDYQTAVERSRQTVGLLGRYLADQTSRMVQDIDFELADFSEWTAMATGATASPAAVRGQLVSHVMRLPYVHSAAVFGRDGALVATTEVDARARVNVADRPIFAVPKSSASDSLYIGTTRVSPRDGYRTFAVSRRLHAPDGSFAGVVIVRVAFEYLGRFYQTIDMSPGASVVLARSDGEDLARYPDDVSGASPGDALPANSLQHPIDSPPTGPDSTLRTREARIVSRQTVAGYPLVVEVNQPLAQALAPWRTEELASAARTLALAVLAGLLLAGIAMALRRREQAEAAQRVTEDRLQEARKAEALSLLAASVAHDFNNVLSAIVGYGELARGSADTSSLVVQRIDRLLAAAERARQLVRRVLSFDPHRSLNYTNVALVPVVREVLDQVQAIAPAGVTIDANFADSTAEVRGDATEIYQVVMNLCTNAMHAMPNGGTLDVRLDAVTITTPRALAVGRLEPGEWSCLSISDQGDGMSANELTAIFETLYTTKPSGRGTGIGLTVVRNIVTSMHGAVEVASVPRTGTRFSVYWPRADEDASRPHGSAAEQRPGRGQTLLIVDDELQLVALVEEMAASLGYEAVGFSDPERALAAIRRDPDRFDAVLTDERMPALRGTAFARAVHELRPELPVILVTAYRGAQLDLDARRCGIVDVLDKPVRLNELSRALGEVFRKVDSPVPTP
jgi:signal transduction histidine kinase/ActR/RegA family two-component response regulator